MSIEIVNDQIIKFIENDESDVIAIKGSWGVGKTYTWDKLLKEKKDDVTLKKYSYVSLFGINSLDSLKYSIFENAIGRELIGEFANLETFKNNVATLSGTYVKKAMKFFNGVEGFKPALNSYASLSINNTLICIDDIERRGEGLSIKDVLGLISLLREQRKCKIILLLNEGEEGLDDYIKYKEKVVDVELTYSPTPEECAEVAFQKNDYESNTLKKLAIELDIKNIRVLKKIEKMAYMMKPLLEEFEVETKYDALHSLTLYLWCHYCSKSDTQVPSLEYVLEQRSFLWLDEPEEEGKKEKTWRRLLSDYNYQGANCLDQTIAESTVAGFIVEIDFKNNAKLVNDDILVSKSEGSFTKAWDLFHNNFENNTIEVIQGLTTSFITNVKNISVINLNGTVSLFRKLGADDKATELIDYYIKERKEENQLFHLDDFYDYGDLPDDEIEKKFSLVSQQLVNQRSVDEAFNEIIKECRFDNGDMSILKNASVDDYYNFFKSINDRKISQYVKRCLSFNGADEEIHKKSKQALLKIASESKVNEHRVSRYKIDIE